MAWPAIHVWPSYSRESQAQDAKLLFAGQELIFGKFRLGAINGLLCFKIVVAKDGEELSSVVTLKVPVQDMPEGRDDAIFQSIVSDEKSFVRYLMFLLATESSVGDIAKVRGLGRQRGGGGSQNDGLEVPFFEELMRAYVRTPERIDSIDAVISRLKTGEGQDKGPVSPEFLLIWNEVWKARCEARGAI